MHLHTSLLLTFSFMQVHQAVFQFYLDANMIIASPASGIVGRLDQNTFIVHAEEAVGDEMTIYYTPGLHAVSFVPDS